MDPTSIKARRIRDTLHAKRDALLSRYRGELDRADEEQSQQSDLVDAASDQWDVRVLAAMSEADATALGDVVAALDRLDQHRYGACVSCGQRISPGRLRVLPQAAECAECAGLEVA
jgi:RNA polymerase-binding transcription factor DksA